MLAFEAAAQMAVPDSLMKDAWLEPTYSRARCLWIAARFPASAASRDAIISGARIALSRQTCRERLAEMFCTRGARTWSGIPAPGAAPTSVGTRRPKSVMVANGIGSLSMTAGISRVTSALVCTPSSNLHGSFLRERPCMHRLRSSFICRPFESRGAGVQYGSSRSDALHDSPRTVAVRVAVSHFPAFIARTFSCSAAASSASARETSHVCSCTVSIVLSPMKERVTPPAALGNGRLVSDEMCRCRALMDHSPPAVSPPRKAPLVRTSDVRSRATRACRSSTPGTVLACSLRGHNSCTAWLHSTPTPAAAGGWTTSGGRLHACRAALRAALGTRAHASATPGSHASYGVGRVDSRTLIATTRGASRTVRLIKGWSAADERRALSTLMPAMTRLSAILVPSVCVSSVDCAASRAPDLVYATSVSSTDLSLQRNALYHLRTTGVRQAPLPPPPHPACSCGCVACGQPSGGGGGWAREGVQACGSKVKLTMSRFRGCRPSRR